MSDITDYAITEAMINHGGSFVVLLGSLYRIADATNQAKLKAAFLEYFAWYREVVARASKRLEPQPGRHDETCMACGWHQTDEIKYLVTQGKAAI